MIGTGQFPQKRRIITCTVCKGSYPMGGLGEHVERHMVQALETLSLLDDYRASANDN